MDLFGVNVWFILIGIGASILTTLLVGLIITASLTIAGGSAVLLFWKTKRIVIPKVTLFLLSLLETPIKSFIRLFNIDESFLSYMIVEIRNRLYTPYYTSTPYNQRMLFLPQCLRSPKCPAPLDAEGIQCKNCGRCGICKIKEEAENLGYKVFIAPGSTLMKRMVKKYKPKAIIGVGCHMEVEEGMAALAAYGVPAQGVILDRDGCVNTRVDVLKLMEKIRIVSGKDDVSKEGILKKANEISGMWDYTLLEDIEIKKVQSVYKK